jgi:hypothetical protein
MLPAVVVSLGGSPEHRRQSERLGIQLRRDDLADREQLE